MYLDGRRQQIKAWVEQGLNDRQIAELCRVSPSTVRYWRERNGVVKPAKAEGAKRGKKPPQKPSGNRQKKEIEDA